MTVDKNKKPAYKNRTTDKPKTVKPNTDKDIDAAFRHIVKTQAGIDVLRYIMDKCGYKLPNVVRQMNVSADGKTVHMGDILPFSTLYNESKRDVWLTIRKKIPPERLNVIEAETEHLAETESL